MRAPDAGAPASVRVRRGTVRPGRAALLVGAFLLTLSGPLEAQRLPVPSAATADAFALDFAVPESPAFNVMEVDESNILRPATVRELAVSLSEFGTSDFILPRSFAVEVAPALLVGGSDLTRQKYAENDWLYRLRVSAATQRVDDASSATRMAFGIRTALADGADLRTNADADAFAVFKTAVLQDRVESKADFEQRLRRVFDISTADVTDELTTAVDSLYEGKASASGLFLDLGLDSAQVAQVFSMFETMGATADVEAVIDRERKRLQKKNWNARVVEVAYAALAEAADSTGKDLELRRHAVWVTAAFPLGAWGQLLVGAEGGMREDTLTDDFDSRGSLGTRLYMGSNSLKFFVEVEGDFQDDRRPEYLVNSGGEIRPPFGGWVDFSVGLNRDAETDDYDLVTEFRWSLPFDFGGGG